MKRHRIFLFVLCSTILPASIWGQTDTTYVLPSVEITAPLLRQTNTGGRSQHWNAGQLKRIKAHDIGELLANEGGLFIKSYGLGSLATSSVRGASAGHTLVLWNGLPIQSPMLGQLDFSLLPANFADEVSLQYGGGTALWGSGAIGGVVSLNNAPDFSKTLSVEAQTGVGSFGNFQQQLNLKAGNEKVSSTTRLFHHQANNNFSYAIRPDLPKREQTHATRSQQGVLQSFHVKINQKQQLSAHVWQQFSHREIPPTTVQTRSEAYQDDRATRLLVAYKRTGEKSITQAKMGMFAEGLDYVDDAIGLISNSRFTSFVGEADHQITLKTNHRIYLGSTHTYTIARSAGYVDPPSEYRGALFASYRKRHKGWIAQGSLRQERVNDRWVPLVPVLGIEGQLTPVLSLKAKVSRDYRLPTLNDRFWQPGGNPDLLPESGWSEELSLKAHHSIKAFRMEYTVTGFNRNIDNWIMWSLQPGQNYWSANNVTKVWSRGLEQQALLTYQKKDLMVEWRAGYDYILSTNQIAIRNPDMARGQQLWYTPKHQLKGKLSLQMKKLYVAYQHQFTSGFQGVNENLSSYQVARFHLQYEEEILGIKGVAFVNIENIWDASYSVVERRPMPGRYYLLGINLLFNT